MHCTRAQRSQTTTISCHTTQYDHCKDISHLLVINSAYNNSLISILGHNLFHIRNYAVGPGKPTLRVTDSKYRESLDRFENSKTLKICLKNAFREFSSKILFRFSKNLTSSRNSQKTKIHLFTSFLKYAKNIRKIDKVLGIRIETIYNFRTRDKLSTKVSPFFYLTIGSF